MRDNRDERRERDRHTELDSQTGQANIVLKGVSLRHRESGSQSETNSRTGETFLVVVLPFKL